MAATRDLQIPFRHPGNRFGYKVKAGVRIFNNTLCGLDENGFAAPLGTDGVVAFAGLSDTTIDNRDGGDGDQAINLVRDVRGFSFNATPSNLNMVVYGLDDETVALDGGGMATGNLIQVGMIVGLDDSRVWVDLSK